MVFGEGEGGDNPRVNSRTPACFRALSKEDPEPKRGYKLEPKCGDNPAKKTHGEWTSDKQTDKITY